MMKVAVQFEDAESFTKHDFEFHEAMILASDHQYLRTFWNHFETCDGVIILLSMRRRMLEDPNDFERIHQKSQCLCRCS